MGWRREQAYGQDLRDSDEASLTREPNATMCSSGSMDSKPPWPNGWLRHLTRHWRSYASGSRLSMAAG